MYSTMLQAASEGQISGGTFSNPNQTIVREPTPLTETDVFILKFSTRCRPFKLPEYPEVAQIMQNHFSEDEGVIVDWEFDYGEKIYIIECTRLFPVDQNVEFKVNKKIYKMKLDPQMPGGRRRGSSKGRSGKEDGVLLTFYKGGRKELRGIKNHVFDSVIQNELKLEILKPTERQRIRGSTVFNGNKYCVVKRPVNMARIPEMMPVTDPTTQTVYHIRINYYGQVRFCPRCEEEHAGLCPELEEFYRVKAEREQMANNGLIATKLMSDSTLRHANYIGLRADVLCMSGGGLGQITQAIKDDPDASGKNIVIIAGANDIKNHNYQNEDEYAENIDKSLQKLEGIVTEDPVRHFTIVKSHPKNIEGQEDEGDASKRKRQYLHKKIDQTVAKIKEEFHNLHTIDIKYDTDTTGHPTIKATAEILQTLDDSHLFENGLIWKKKYITHDRIYRGVQAIFRYGCNICDGYGEDIQHSEHKTYSVCDKCMDNIKLNAEKGHPILDSIREAQRKERGVVKRNRDSESDEEERKKRTKDKKKDTRKRTDVEEMSKEREDGEITEEEMREESDGDEIMEDVPEKDINDGRQSDTESTCSTNTITSDA